MAKEDLSAKELLSEGVKEAVGSPCGVGEPAPGPGFLEHGPGGKGGGPVPGRAGRQMAGVVRVTGGEWAGRGVTEGRVV